MHQQASRWGTAFLLRLVVLVCILACLEKPSAQTFRIQSVSVDPSGKVFLQHESSTAFYYILYSGQEVIRIDQVEDMVLGEEVGFSDLSFESNTQFYRIEAVPADQPRDTDGDGIDDLYELLRPDLLHPLNGSDAGEDPDGNGLTHREEYLLSQQDLTVYASSPSHGEGGVAVTRETILRFSNPLAEGTTMTEEVLFAQFGGQRLPGRIHLSSDRKKVTLFYQGFLPASARVRVTLNGDLIEDEFGRRVDADRDGEPGGTGIVDFETLSLTVLEGTAVCGRVFASELTRAPEGSLSVNTPLEGVRITVDGMEEELFAVTDEAGNFRLDPAPTGRFFVHIDGRSAEVELPVGAYYPFVGKAWESIPEEEVNIGEVYLPLIQEGTLQVVDPDQETVIRMAPTVLEEFPEFSEASVRVPPGSLFFDDGSPGQMVGISPVPPDRLPGQLPPGLDFPMVITVQTGGASNFDVPAPVCFPNLPDPVTGEVLAPGARSALWSFNHDTGRFEVVGSATVSEDGELICTDPGVGIPAPGWHSIAPFSVLFGGKLEEQLQEAVEAAQDVAVPSVEDDQVRADGDGGHADDQPETNCNISFHNGEEYFTVTDLSVPGRGDIHFQMARRYRSRLVYDGPIGHGWDFKYNERLFPQPNGDVLRGDGFGHLDRWKRIEDGRFAVPEGHFSQLVQGDDDTYILRKPNGFLHFYSPDGRLRKHQDRHGNIMQFFYDPRGNLDIVVDPFGREYDFVFQTFPDGRDRLVSVIDFIGRTVVYNYDERFDLVQVRSPVVRGTSTGNDFPQGRVERYRYSSGFAEEELNHNILTRTFPVEVVNGGPPAFQWSYGENPDDPLTFDRVISRTRGGANASGVAAGGTMTLKYERLNENEPPGDLSLERWKVTHTDRRGDVTEYFFNERFSCIKKRVLTRGLREGDPEFFETTYEHDVDGQLTRVVFPEGNAVQIEYDRQGARPAHRNPIRMERISDPSREGGDNLVTTFGYDPVYQFCIRITDPRGNDPTFQPPLGEGGPERYQVQFFCDYQEGEEDIPFGNVFDIDLSQVQRGLGDLNGDGRTDQVGGDLVLEQQPTVQLLENSEEAAVRGVPSQTVIVRRQFNVRGQLVATIDPEGNKDTFEYYPEDDPDGDGKRNLSPLLGLDGLGGGYLARVIVDSETTPDRTSETEPVQLATTFEYDPVGNPVATKDARGVKTQFEVNAWNQVVVSVRGADVTDAVQSGQLLSEDEPFAYRVRYHYDHNGRITRHEIENRDSNTEGVGEFVHTDYTYDILHNVVQVEREIDATQQQTIRYRYDEDENLVQVTQPEGNQHRIDYDERDLLLLKTLGHQGPDASTTQYVYDLNGNLVEIIDAEDNNGDGEPERTTFHYDGFDRFIGQTDSLGNQFNYTLDPADNVIRYEVTGHPPGQPGASIVPLVTRQFDYDELNRLYQIHQHLFVSDGFNPVREVVLQDDNSDGRVTDRIEYDGLGRRTFLVEDDQQITRFVYDGADRLIHREDHAGNVQRFVYDRNSNIVGKESIEKSPEGLVPEETFITQNVYDQLNRRVRSTDNAGQTTRYQYDSRNNLIGISDAQGPLMDDPLGLFPGPINDRGNTTAFVYDGLDRVLQKISDLRAEGQGGRPIDTSNPFHPSGQVVMQYVYDLNSRLTAFLDPNGNRTSFQYDELNRRTRYRNADNTEYQYAYDRDHNTAQITDPNGTVIANTYDALNRLKERTVIPGEGVHGTGSVSYEYDGLSRLTRSSDDNGNPENPQVSVFIYDSLSRMLEEHQNGRVTSTQWSGDSKPLQYTYPNGRVIEQGFDPIDRINQILDEGNSIAEFRYIGPGVRELIRNMGNNTVATYLSDQGDEDIGYDEVRRIRQLRHFHENGGASPLLLREYGYNRYNVRTFEERNDGFLKEQSLSAVRDEYRYDSLYRVVRTALDQGSSTVFQRDTDKIDYLYDGVGNRRQVDLTSRSEVESTVEFLGNEMNEYEEINGITRIHDGNGNLIDDGAREYVYDFRNRLIAVRDKSTGNRIVEYNYFADNRRSRKIVFDELNPNQVEKVLEFFYSMDRVCEERDGTTGEPEITYVYGPQNVDDIIQAERTPAHPLGEASVYHHLNARNDVAALTDRIGNVLQKILYEDFGGPAFSSTLESKVYLNHGSPYLFQGRRYDGETDLYYFRNRYYNHETGRFIQRDPVWDERNKGGWYSFVGNSPVSRRDPLGLNSAYTGFDSGQFPELSRFLVQFLAPAILGKKQGMPNVSAIPPPSTMDYNIGLQSEIEDPIVTRDRLIAEINQQFYNMFSTQVEPPRKPLWPPPRRTTNNEEDVSTPNALLLSIPTVPPHSDLYLGCDSPAGSDRGTFPDPTSGPGLIHGIPVQYTVTAFNVNPGLSPVDMVTSGAEPSLTVSGGVSVKLPAGWILPVQQPPDAGKQSILSGELSLPIPAGWRVPEEFARPRGSRTARNPVTGAEIRIPAEENERFAPGKGLKP